MHDLTTQPISAALPRTGLIPKLDGRPLRPAPGGGVATYDTRSRLTRWLQSNAVAIGVCAPAPVALAYAIAQILGAR